ncbi:MAG: hypothetical protein KFW07_03720, partial [Mycoplasmataceae bacterium]|nr:hypothetical protein [Mycoplasmataceae bacterium]
SGTTNNINIQIEDSLYRSVSFSNNIALAKQNIEIRFRLSTHVPLSEARNADDFKTYLSSLRVNPNGVGDSLNNVITGDIVANYFFTESGMRFYESTSVINSNNYEVSNKEKPNTTNLSKSLDLTGLISQIKNVTANGSTSEITWANLIPTALLDSLGLKIEWSYWISNPAGEILRSPWVSDAPGSVLILNNPNNPDNYHPISIRLSKKDPSDKLDLLDFTSGTPVPTNEIIGYAVNVENLIDILEINDQLGVNYKVSGLSGNVVSMDLKPRYLNLSGMAQLNLKVQFSIGSSLSTLSIGWTDENNFKSAIATYNETKDILLSELNIYIRLVLIAEPDNPDNPDIVNGIKYNWDKRELEVYNNVTGSNPIFTSPATARLRAYSRISSTWADSLSAEGNKSNEIKIYDKEGKFDFTYYSLRGIRIEVNPNNGDTWIMITEFNKDIFDASLTNKMKFRLSVVDDTKYEIYGTDVIETTTPVGTMTKVIEKDIISKIGLVGVSASNLFANIKVTGSTFNLNIVEADELYTVSGMSVAEAKTFFEIKYSIGNDVYLNKTAFIDLLKASSGDSLNNLNIENFKVRYEFTEAGKLKYYSDQVFGDVDAVEANITKKLDMNLVIKTIDLNGYIANVANILLTGNTTDITYANELDYAVLFALGVKVQWDYWVVNSTGTVERAGWVDEKPTRVDILKNPDDLTKFPIALRFSSINPLDSSIELKDIVSGVANDINTTNGYELDTKDLKEIVTISDQLGVNYKVKGIVGNVVSMNPLADLNNVSALATKHLELQFAIGSSSNDADLVINWSNQSDFKTAITTY